MKTPGIFRFLCISLALLPATAGAAERIGDFGLLDQQGNFHQMSWYDDHSAIALLVQANDSESTVSALPRYVDLHEQFSEQGIQFFMINPQGRLNRDAVNEEISRITTDIPVLMDDTQVIAEALEINKTGEVFLYDPSSFTVMFRGPVGAEFEQAIIAVLNDEEIPVASVTMAGADVAYPASHDVSYANDIAPILSENCASCHREGGIAPFALNGHTMAQGWSPMIREVLMTKRMPPGQIDRHVHEFENGRYLTIADTQKLIRWIDAGAPRGEGSDPLAELKWPESRWNVPYGEPDLIVKVPSQEIPATGVLDYVHLQVPIEGMTEDRWVRASEFIPGDRTVVHHSTANVGGFESRRDPDAALISRFVPGQEPRIEPPNTGGLLKKDSMLNVTMHYTTSGKETVDESEYGIWFYPEGVVPEKRMRGTMVGRFANNWIDIPAYEKHFEMSNSYTLREDVTILGYHPHMHFRGKDLRMYAEYPDGSSEELINIANYSYAWQLTYRLREPFVAPAGTKITAIGHFDNSTQNTANPDPAYTVPWGEQSWDEMFFGEFIYLTENK